MSASPGTLLIYFQQEGADMIVVGFTGTCQGMTWPQMKSVFDLLNEDFSRSRSAHHGDCLGADCEFHFLAYEWFGLHVTVHPPESDKYRAFCEGDALMPELPYLERNRNIVSASDVLIAAPFGPWESRSGTWFTINNALDNDVPVHIVHFDGTVERKG
jgi:hypothetical protein